MCFSKRITLSMIIACCLSFPATSHGCPLKSIVQTIINSSADDLTQEVEDRIQSFVKKFGINASFDSGNTLLHYAAQMPREKTIAQRELIEFLFRLGADATIQNTSNQTPLHFAATNNARSIHCILSGLNHLRGSINFIGNVINKQDDLGQTALHRAVLVEDEESVKILIYNDAQLLEDEAGNTPLFYAALTNTEETIQTLLTAKIDTPMHYRALQTIDQLIKMRQGAAIKKILLALDKDPKKAASLLLFYATKENIFLHLIPLLIRIGANPCYVQTGDNSAIYYAIKSRNYALAFFLTDHSLQEDLVHLGSKIFVPLVVHESCSDEATMLLMQKRMHEQLSLSDETTVLKKLCVKPNWPLLKEFLHIDIQIDEHATDFDVLLQIFTVCKTTESGKAHLKKLFACNIDKYTQDETQKSLVHYLVEQNNHDDLALALELGANPNKSNNAGRTPLMNAFAEQKYQCAMVLIECRKTEITLRDANGKTALWYAQEETFSSLALIALWIDHIRRTGRTNDELTPLIRNLYNEIQIIQLKDPRKIEVKNLSEIFPFPFGGKTISRFIIWFFKIKFDPNNDQHLLIWIKSLKQHTLESLEEQSQNTRSSHCPFNKIFSLVALSVITFWAVNRTINSIIG